MNHLNVSPGVVIGIDAAVVAAHHVAVRDGDRLVRFKVFPTLAGMSELTERLRPYAGAVVTAEPTGGTWLPLGVAVTEAGCRFQLVDARSTSKLRESVSREEQNRPDRRVDAPRMPVDCSTCLTSRHRHRS